MREENVAGGVVRLRRWMPRTQRFDAPTKNGKARPVPLEQYEDYGDICARGGISPLHR